MLRQVNENNNSTSNNHITQSASLFNLPSDMLLEILSRLPLSSAILLARTSIPLRGHILNDEIDVLRQFWRSQLKQYFPEVEEETEVNYARHFISHYLLLIEDGYWIDLENANTAIKKNREIVLAAVKQNGLMLQYADEKFKSDREIVLVAVQQSGGALQHADQSLKGDREIVLAAVQQSGGAFQYADQSLKGDRELVLAVVKRFSPALWYADPSLKSDREIVLAAVQQYGETLQFADPSLRSDREVVLTAVKRAGCALQYADKSLKSDRGIVLAAVKSWGLALQYADVNLQKDPVLSRLSKILNDEARAKACDEYAQSIRYAKALMMDEVKRKLQQPNFTRADILNLLEEIKDPQGKYKVIHQPSEMPWDTFGLRFKFSKNNKDDVQSQFTPTYQNAVELLNEAYELRGDDDLTDIHISYNPLTYARGSE